MAYLLGLGFRGLSFKASSLSPIGFKGLGLRETLNPSISFTAAGQP